MKTSIADCLSIKYQVEKYLPAFPEIRAGLYTAYEGLNTSTLFITKEKLTWIAKQGKVAAA